MQLTSQNMSMAFRAVLPGLVWKSSKMSVWLSHVFSQDVEQKSFYAFFFLRDRTFTPVLSFWPRYASERSGGVKHDCLNFSSRWPGGLLSFTLGVAEIASSGTSASLNWRNENLSWPNPQLSIVMLSSVHCVIALMCNDFCADNGIACWAEC